MTAYHSAIKALRWSCISPFLLATVVLLTMTSPISASQLQIRLQDNTQQLLSNVVIELIPVDAAIVNSGEQVATSRAAKQPKIMKQLNQQFVPHILPVQKGTEVEFPDTDTVQHHVYSFSPAKVFEIAIYKEALKRNIMFDHAGVVELGCNIHDWMLGYIYIANSALFAQTDSKGVVSFSVPLGEYTVKIWHPRIQQNDIDTPRSINYQRENAEQATLHTIELTADILPSYTEYDDVHGLSEY